VLGLEVSRTAYQPPLRQALGKNMPHRSLELTRQPELPCPHPMHRGGVCHWGKWLAYKSLSDSPGH
jgi:hypothetical protein